MSVGPVLTYNMVYTTIQFALIDIEWVNTIQNSFSDAICSMYICAVIIIYNSSKMCVQWYVPTSSSNGLASLQ